MATADFKDEIQKRVDQARSSYKRQQEENLRRSAEKREAGQQRIKELVQLRAEARSILEEAAEGSDALTFHALATAGGGEESHLTYDATPPKRTLTVRIDLVANVGEVGWTVDDRLLVGKVFHPPGDAETVRRFVYALIDQDGWAEGRSPAV